MTWRYRCLLLVCAFGLAAPQVYAQQGGGRGRGLPPSIDPSQLPTPGGRGGRFGAPPRDAQEPAGTATISGRVVSADGATPLRRAQVRLSSPNAPVNRTATTDVDGKYSFTGLAAARYRLQISKAGYVTLEYGQARPFEAGKPLDLADGQTLTKIDFSLPRGSVIAGRVTDEFGEPVTDANVQAMRYQFVNGQRQLVPAGRTAVTDDIGQYRVFGLMPGDYIVRATVRSNGLMAVAVGSGPVENSGYAPTYFPGTPDVAQAQTVTVALGQELNSVFLSLSPAKLAHVSGSVIDSQGRPLTAAVVVVRPAAGGGAGGALNVGGANQVRGDGTFSLSNVPPGEYTLDVQQRPRDLQGMGTTQLEFGSVPLSVAGADITGLTIITTPGVSVSGRVVLQSQRAQTTPLRGIQIGAATPSGTQSLLGIAGRALGGGRVGDDGSFQLRGLSGPQLIRVNNVPSGWVLKSMSLDGQDITDAPFDFKAGHDFSGLTITLTDQLTDVSGSVHDSRGQVVKDYVLVVFSDDSRLWGGLSRFVRTTRPNQDGNFDIKGLPAGRYLAAVVESLENGAQSDPAVLEQLRGRAKSFTVPEGQAVTLDLPFQP